MLKFLLSQFIKKTGRNPNNLEMILLRRQASKKAVDERKIISMVDRQPIDANKPILGGKNVPETEADILARLKKGNKDSVDRLKNKKDPEDPQKFYQGGQAQIEPSLSDIGHGSDALMARNALLTPGSQATTSTGLNYLLGEDNDTTRVPYNEGLKVEGPDPRVLELMLNEKMSYPEALKEIENRMKQQPYIDERYNMGPGPILEAADGGRAKFENGDMVLPKEKPMDEYILKKLMSQAGAETLDARTRDMFIQMYKKKIREKNKKADGGRTEFKFGGNPHESDSKAGSGQTSGKRSAPPGEKGGAGYVAPYTPPPGERGGAGYIAPTPKTGPVTTGDGNIYDKFIAAGSVPFNYGKSLFGDPFDKKGGFKTKSWLNNLQKTRFNEIAKRSKNSGVVGYEDYYDDPNQKSFTGFDGLNFLDATLATTIGSGRFSKNPKTNEIENITGKTYDFDPKSNFPTASFINQGGLMGVANKFGENLYEDQLNNPDNNYLTLAEGGPARQNFKMGKRAFLKWMASGAAGIAGLKTGLFGLSKKSAVKSVIAPATQAANEAAVPPYFLNLVSKIKKMGDETLATKDKAIAKKYKDYTMEEDFAGNIEIIKKGDNVSEDVFMSLKVDDVPLKGKKGSKKVKEYEEYTATPDAEGKMKNIEQGVPDEVVQEGNYTFDKADGGRIGYGVGSKVIGKGIAAVTKKAGEGKFTKNEVLLNMFKNTIKQSKSANTKKRFTNFIEEIKLKPELSKDPNVWNFFTKGLPKNQKLVVYGDDTVDFWTQSEFGPHNIATSAKFQKKHPYLTKDQAVKIQNMEPEDQIFEMKRLEVLRKRTANASGGIAAMLGE